MATYGLIGAHNPLADGNPGCRFITDGIRWLIRQIDPAAVFMPVELLHEDAAGWSSVLNQADALLLCGNPRFNLDPTRVYCDFGIWRNVLDAVDANIPFIEAWAGAAHPFPLSDVATMAQEIASLKKIETILGHESRAACCIARDKVAYTLLGAANPNAKLLPCSTWHAAAEHNITSQEKDRHCITLRKMPGNSWIIDRALELQRELEDELPTYVLVHSTADRRWVATRRRVHNLLCITDAESLLRFYARVDKLLSLRIHGSIPALSLGARVCSLSMDSRSLAVDEFGISSVPFLEFRDPSFLPRFARCLAPPDPNISVSVLGDALVRAGSLR